MLIEFEAQSSFALKTAEFTELAKDLAVHVAAVNPPTVNALLEQGFIKNPATSVGELLSAAVLQLKEDIRVLRFVCWSTDEPPDSRRSDASP